jgi:hypothetical protein
MVRQQAGETPRPGAPLRQDRNAATDGGVPIRNGVEFNQLGMGCQRPARRNHQDTKHGAKSSVSLDALVFWWLTGAKERLQSEAIRHASARTGALSAAPRDKVSEIPRSSFRRKPESRPAKAFRTPAFAGVKVRLMATLFLGRVPSHCHPEPFGPQDKLREGSFMAVEEILRFARTDSLISLQAPNFRPGRDLTALRSWLCGLNAVDLEFSPLGPGLSGSGRLGCRFRS